METDTTPKVPKSVNATFDQKLNALQEAYNTTPFELMSFEDRSKIRESFRSLLLETIDPESVTLTASQARLRAVDSIIRDIKLKITQDVEKTETNFTINNTRLTEDIILRLKGDGYEVTNIDNKLNIKW